MSATPDTATAEANCRQCGSRLWALRSIECGLCSACHPEGRNVHPNWDSLDAVKFPGCGLSHPHSATKRCPGATP